MIITYFAIVEDEFRYKKIERRQIDSLDSNCLTFTKEHVTIAENGKQNVYHRNFNSICRQLEDELSTLLKRVDDGYYLVSNGFDEDTYFAELEEDC